MLDPIVVCQRTFSAELLQHLNERAQATSPPRRKQMAREACQLLAWYSPDGRPAISSAKVALRKLERRGVLQLPPDRGGSRPDIGRPPRNGWRPNRWCWWRRTEAKGRGLWLHSVLAMRPDGVPLGALDAQSCARPPEAWERVQWYCRRWVIEEWHRVLKSGCGVEQREFETAETLQRALAFELTVAWRLLVCVKLGRILPQLPASLLYTAEELAVLEATFKKKGNDRGARGWEPTLDEANRLVACWGRWEARGQPQRGLGQNVKQLFHDSPHCATRPSWM